MPSAQMRAFLGFVAAAISVLTFHQGMVIALHGIAPGWVPFAAFRTTPVPPFGVPTIVSNCFWGGVWGTLFGLLLPRFTWEASARRHLEVYRKVRLARRSSAATAP